MSRFKKMLAVWLCCGTLVSQGLGQDLPESSAPNGVQAPPVFGVLDTGGYFNRNPSALKRISEHLRKLHQDHGYMIYLVVEPVLIASSPAEKAAELRQAWVPEGNGLVVVFETDSRSMAIGRDLVDRQSKFENLARVPTYEAAALLSRAMGDTDPRVAPEVYLEALTGRITSEFDGYFKRRDTPPPATRNMRIALLVIGTLSLLGLGAIGLGGLMRHSRIAGVRSFRFPAVDLPERLGAPCGGSVTARRFAPPGPRAL
ncbi:MAG: TPM domain-containing protein [Verrucomicrobiota bacterium]